MDPANVPAPGHRLLGPAGYRQRGPELHPPEKGIKFAVIVVATLPILVFYPFLQKHFAKGMLIGSVKG
ncbi:hypothetical protein ACLKOZ_15060 [Arthrobacter sp. R4]|uniref:hypothetical protein n=1 Tax=Arthrobacter sp. R4 TaxID=644417 RepID=UPI003ED98F8D